MLLKMSRDLSTFPLSQHARFKLQSSGFTTSEDLNGFKPNELSLETGLSLQESLAVLSVVHHPASPSVSSRSAQDVLQEETCCPPLPTSCRALDAALRGGVPLGKVVEVCGCPGAGKTQLGMQLCVNVQIPESLGGLAGEAFFIDTEGSFVVQRLVQLANACIRKCKSATQSADVKDFTVDKVLRGIHYYPCKSYTELIARVNLLSEFLTQHKKVSLVVVDSIAFHFRYGFDGSYSLRTRLLNGIVQTLVKAANEHKIAVLLTNQMTTKINEDGSSHLVPALGESWGHACAIRLILSHNEQQRQAHLFKSPSMAEARVNYCITKDGFEDM